MSPPTRTVPILLALLLLHCTLSPTERLLNRGDDLYKKGDLDGAAERYTRALESAPDNARALYGMGVVHYTRKDYEQALTFFGRAVEHANENPAYRLQRGHTLLRLKSFDRAIEDYETVIRLDPGRVSAYYSIGIAYYNARDYRNAARWLKRYLDVAPRADDREAVEQLIHSLREWS
jgi:tetratricopeptide (TPR) repeat protein